jgi:hypothetical protein
LLKTDPTTGTAPHWQVGTGGTTYSIPPVAGNACAGIGAITLTNP